MAATLRIREIQKDLVRAVPRLLAAESSQHRPRRYSNRINNPQFCHFYGWYKAAKHGRLWKSMEDMAGLLLLYRHNPSV